MKNRWLYAAWGGMFVLCALLGLLSQVTGAAATVRTVLGLLFFVPGGLLLARGLQGERRTLRILRLISGLSLGLTLIALVANFLTVLSPDPVAKAMHILLGIVSAPMLCIGHWAWSMFLWACLLTASFVKLPEK